MPSKTQFWKIWRNVSLQIARPNASEIGNLAINIRETFIQLSPTLNLRGIEMIKIYLI